MLPIFVAADQFADVFAAGAIASSGDLLVDELLQVIGQGNIHGAHPAMISGVGKNWQGRPRVISGATLRHVHERVRSVHDRAVQQNADRARTNRPTRR